jgi:hypothetical protein
MIGEGMPWAILLPLALMFLLWGIARGKNEAKNSRPQETAKKQPKKKKKPVVG